MEPLQFSSKMFKKQSIETRSFAYIHGCAEWVASQVVDPKYSGHQQQQKIAYFLLLAVALEGLLNHAGIVAFPWWRAAERTLSTEAKLQIICEHCSIEFIKSARPIQTLRQLVAFRNDIAHPKTTTTLTEPIRILDERFTPTKWQAFAAHISQELVKADVDAFAGAVWAAMNLDPGHKSPFSRLQWVEIDSN